MVLVTLQHQIYHGSSRKAGKCSLACFVCGI